MGELKKWRDQKWVRIGSDGKIKGPCGTSKDKKNPDRCLPLAKARSLSKQWHHLEFWLQLRIEFVLEHFAY